MAYFMLIFMLFCESFVKMTTKRESITCLRDHFHIMTLKRFTRKAQPTENSEGVRKEDAEDAEDVEDVEDSEDSEDAEDAEGEMKANGGNMTCSIASHDLQLQLSHLTLGGWPTRWRCPAHLWRRRCKRRRLRRPRRRFSTWLRPCRCQVNTGGLNLHLNQLAARSTSGCLLGVYL